MRRTLVVAVVLLGVVSAVSAELQNVSTGGSLRIRGNWYTGAIWNWDSGNGNTMANVEQRTRLNVKADFSDEVSAFVEVDSYDIWGEDFRSNWLTGADGRAVSVDDVEFYQAYIEANEMWGHPLRLRVGRQELAFGSQWLLGVNDASSAFTGLSFDAARLTYKPGDFTIDAVWAKLADTSPLEEDGDVDLYVLYGSYAGIENITLDAYWMYVRDARALPADTPLTAAAGLVLAGIENWAGLDEWGPTTLHTIGVRGAGTALDGALDFEAELAYQFGEADAVGKLFRYAYSDNDARYDYWGLNLQAGYTFDVAWKPRVYLGFAWLDGEDNRKPDSFGEWLYSAVWPLSRPDASMGFNRLFSNWEYSEFIENSDMSNVWVLRGGLNLVPAEKIKVLAALSYFHAVDEFENYRWFRFPWNPSDVDGSLGWEAAVYVTYSYSEDLTFEAGWAHLFTGDGLPEGNFANSNALANHPGTHSDGVDYWYIETKITF